MQYLKRNRPAQLKKLIPGIFVFLSSIVKTKSLQFAHSIWNFKHILAAIYESKALTKRKVEVTILFLFLGSKLCKSQFYCTGVYFDVQILCYQTYTYMIDLYLATLFTCDIYNATDNRFRRRPSENRTAFCVVS